jgi:hypothetical protein
MKPNARTGDSFEGADLMQQEQFSPSGSIRPRRAEIAAAPRAGMGAGHVELPGEPHTRAHRRQVTPCPPQATLAEVVQRINLRCVRILLHRIAIESISLDSLEAHLLPGGIVSTGMIDWINLRSLGNRPPSDRRAS